ncbi:MAG: 3-keto-disaccharide hydrolase, partial [Planctomycetota bacterium]
MRRITTLIAVSLFLMPLVCPARAAEALNQPPEGFVALFNGHDLTGWKGLVGNPKTRARMSAQQLAEAQAKADADMRAHWKVVDGVLHFDGKGQSLCTAKDYGDFEMLVDWKIEERGDSGIYLRGSPQVQIWDVANTNVGAQVGSGGLYNNQNNPSKPGKKADKPVGQWNTFRIIMIGEKVTVILNDVLVVDNVTMENYWQRDKPIYPTGQIELQNHGNDLYFRNIYIRQILTAQERTEGFVPLFNGRDMTGWTGNTTGYFAKNGNMLCDPTKAGGNVYTAGEYGNFVLRFDFKLTPGANNGLAIRAPLAGDAAYQAMELQILDNTAAKYADLQPYQYPGSIYGVVPAKRGHLKPVGQWNAEEVIAKGPHVTVNLNGTTIV